jgi:hypothetical protein
MSGEPEQYESDAIAVRHALATYQQTLGGDGLTIPEIVERAGLTDGRVRLAIIYLRGTGRLLSSVVHGRAKSSRGRPINRPILVWSLVPVPAADKPPAFDAERVAVTLEARAARHRLGLSLGSDNVAQAYAMAAELVRDEQHRVRGGQ